MILLQYSMLGGRVPTVLRIGPRYATPSCLSICTSMYTSGLDGSFLRLMIYAREAGGGWGVGGWGGVQAGGREGSATLIHRWAAMGREDWGPQTLTLT